MTFDTSGDVGGRGAYWAGDFEYTGFPLDVLHYRPDIGSQTVRTEALDLRETGLRATARRDTSVSIVAGIAGMLLWIIVTLAMAVRNAHPLTRRRVRPSPPFRHRRPKMPRNWFRRQ